MPAFTPNEALAERDGIVTLRGTIADGKTNVLARLPDGKNKTGAETLLKREWEILAGLNTVGVAVGRGLETIHDEKALLLEDPGGSPLAWLLRDRRELGENEKSPLELGVALRIGASIANALAGLHALRIVHAGLSPQSVLVDPLSGKVWLFGFSQSIRIPKGTPAELWRRGLPSALEYAAPEQTGRMNRPVDERTDLYSLGVLLYEMLTGKPPFAATVNAHLASIPKTPSEMDGRVPAYVSNLVMRLLAKMPENRYRTARGVRLDLERCLDAWQRGVADIVLGQTDISGQLGEPDKLLGREKEQRALEELFALSRAGEARLVTLTGPLGIGRNALVAALRQHVLERGGILVECPLEQRERERPLSALVMALSTLTKTILAEPTERFQVIAKRLLSGAFASGGQPLVDLVPELSLVLGPQPPSPKTGADEAQHRQNLAAEACLAALATNERPIVLVLKDALWADTASLELLRRIFLGRQGHSWMMVLSYKDNEDAPDHSCENFVSALVEASVPVDRIALGPLGRLDTSRLMTQMLGMEPEGIEALAEFVFEKTGGFPYFIRELMEKLVAEGLLYFDEPRSTWRFHLDAITAAALSENVSALTSEKLRTLSENAKETLRFAAAMGRSMDAELLAFVRDIPVEEVRAGLEEAASLGIVIQSAPEEAASGKGALHYRFSHDRLQEAAYSLVPIETREDQHLFLGRRLLEKTAERSTELLFEALSHLRLGGKKVREMAERVRFARLEKEAGERAKAKIAYDAARAHFWHGLEWLGPDAWREERDLTFQLHADLAECSALSDRPNEAIALFEEITKRATKEEQDSAALRQIELRRIELLVRRGEVAKALEIGLLSLERRGVFITEQDAPRPQAEFRQDAPIMTNPDALLFEELLLATAVPAYYIKPAVFQKLIDIWVSFIAKNGHSNRSAFGYVLLALSLVGNGNTLSKAYSIGTFALALDERFSQRTHTCKIIETFAGNIAFFREHIRDVLALFPKAQKAGLASGDFTHVAYICYHTATMRLGAGNDLNQTLEDNEADLALATQTRDAISVGLVSVAVRACRHLLGRASKTRPDVDEEEAALERDGFAVVACYAYSMRAMIAFIEERFDVARHYIKLAEAKSTGLQGQFFATHLPFFSAVTRLQQGNLEEPERHLVEQQIDRLKALAEGNPSNYLHLYLATQAEMARTQNKHGDARERYDEALASAKTNAFPHHEAIIAEMAARYYAARNKTEAAKVYYGRARAAYQRWGAVEKVAQLDQAHEPIAKMALQNADLVEDVAFASGRTLDAVAVVRAAETIAGEIDFDKLIARLMHTLVEIAGADHGALLLSRSHKDHGALLIEAVLNEGPTELQIGLSLPALTSADVSPSIVSHVAQTRAPIVVTNAMEDTRFAADERIVVKRPAAILCFPLIHRGALSGIVYLEHQAMAGVFSKDRVEVLSLLSSQAAIAIENALLVADVRGRTAELSALHEELLRELSERELSERERASLKEGIIAMQKARLAEMRTPFIPVSHDVMVMPLVGTLDQGRAEEALEIALAGTAARSARVVILDVTGVKVMDEIVATTLLRMVEALGLLGAEAIVTGIRGKVAATLIEIDANFANKVRTLSTLSAGMKHALRR